MRLICGCLLGILFLNCHKKTEAELYADLQSSFKYRAYKKASSLAIPKAVEQLNKSDRQAPLSEPTARLYLGYFLAVSQKPDFAIAEANLLLEKGGADYAMLAHTILSVAFYEKKWNTLSRQESDTVKSVLGKSPDGQSAELTLIAAHLLLGTLAIQERNFDFARFHFAAFASLTGMQWTHTLVDAMGDIHAGKLQAGLTKIKTLSDDPALPEEVRAALKEGIAAVEKETGAVDSRLFWPRLVSKALWNKMETASFPGRAKIFGLVDSTRKIFE